ncbi:NosD domain-containing protein, partial [Thermoplasmatota archaeon]
MYSVENYTISHNLIINNSNLGFSLISSENNFIYDNYFDNTLNVISEDGVNNLWNVSKRSGINIIGGSNIGGNYWNNYTGFDYDGDYIGDSYYAINGIENDTLPLKIPNYHIYVDNDESPDWYDETHVQTIQESVSNASIGAEIFVFNGTYNE